MGKDTLGNEYAILIILQSGATGGRDTMLEIEVGLDQVEVDGVIRVLGVAAGEVSRVAGGEGVHFVRAGLEAEFDQEPGGVETMTG